MSRLFEIEDEEIVKMDDSSLELLKKRMTVKYRINVLRATGPFRDDWIFHMNDRKHFVKNELYKREYERKLPEIESFFSSNRSRLERTARIIGGTR